MSSGSKDTSREGLRAWLCNKLRRDVPDALWEYLEAQRYVSEATQSDLGQREKILLEPAKALLRLHQALGGDSPGHEQGHSVAPSVSYMSALAPGDPVYMRAYAAASYLLKGLETHPSVATWRRRLGAPLSREEARDLLRSTESAKGSGSVRHARLFFDGQETFGADVEEGSLLWGLHDVADRLPPGPWRTERLVWWILTTDRPEVEPLQAEIRAGTWPTVTLVVPAWASAESVRLFFKQVKDYVWASEALEVFDQATSLAEAGKGFASTPSYRRMKVFEFITERSGLEGGKLVPHFSWRRLMSEWNSRLPDHHDYFYTDVRNFRRDYRAAKKALFGGD